MLLMLGVSSRGVISVIPWKYGWASTGSAVFPAFANGDELSFSILKLASRS
jgi:hypothetical protein